MERKCGYTVSEQLSLESYFDAKDEISPIDHWALMLHSTQEQKEYWDRFVSVYQGKRPWLQTTNLTTREKKLIVDKINAKISGKSDLIERNPRVDHYWPSEGTKF